MSFSFIPPPPIVGGVEFRHCPGILGYCVGSDGSFWSCRLKGPVVRFGEWHKLALSVVEKRRRVGVPETKPSQRKKASPLILEAFRGPAPPKTECCHEDGNSLNDQIGNLRRDTRSSNVKDAIRHGVARGQFGCGSANKNTKLTPDNVRFIRKNAGVVSERKMAAMFHVNRSVVRQVLQGRSFRYVA